MKVLHVIDRLAVVGAEKMFVTATKALLNNGCDVSALIFNNGYPLERSLHSKLVVQTLNRQHKLNPVTLYEAHKICCGYDIVHAHLRHVYAYIRLGQRMFGGKYKLILHDHAEITNDPDFRISGMLRPRYYIGVNQQQVDWAKTKLGIATTNCFLLENIVEGYGINYINPHNSKAMLTGNIRQVKNIEFAIDLAKHMNYALDIYGNIIEPEYQTDLLQKTADIRFNIHEGITEFASIYPQYSIGIHCSPKETGPLVLLEYLSAGLPFLAYKTGSAAEAISKYLPELFMDNFEIEEWQKRIEQLMEDESLSQKMQAVFKKVNSPEDYVNKCRSIYTSVHSS